MHYSRRKYCEVLLKVLLRSPNSVAIRRCSNASKIARSTVSVKDKTGTLEKHYSGACATLAAKSLRRLVQTRGIQNARSRCSFGVRKWPNESSRVADSSSTNAINFSSARTNLILFVENFDTATIYWTVPSCIANCCRFVFVPERAVREAFALKIPSVMRLARSNFVLIHLS